MFNKTITLFNKKLDVNNRTDKYHKHIIKGCFVDDINQSSTAKNGLDNADSIFIAIPFENAANYLDPLDYKNKVDVSKHFTFKEGDIVVKGEVLEDYQKLKDIQENYSFVYTITKVDIKDFGNKPHFEIAGK